MRANAVECVEVAVDVEQRDDAVASDKLTPLARRAFGGGAEAMPHGGKIRNSKHEIRNEFKIRSKKCSKPPHWFWPFDFSAFEFVSDFGFRISCLRSSTIPRCDDASGRLAPPPMDPP